MMTDFLFATHNAKKLAEIKLMLQPFNITPLSATDVDLPDVEETGETFIENALLKARAGAKHSQLPTLADDSGLIVPALGGLPGVRSARYAGSMASDEDNRNKLLEALKDYPPEAEERTCFFYCVLVLMQHGEDPMPIIAQGSWQGRIAIAPQGSHGFGYDPIFITESGLTAAQIPSDEKHRLSHRGKALRALTQMIPTLCINTSIKPSEHEPSA